MLLTLPNTKSKTIQNIAPVTEKEAGYGNILDYYGLKYQEADYYYQVGEITLVQGWILHISVIRVQFISLLNAIIPILIEGNTPFKIIKNKQIATQLLHGYLGYDKIGKLVSIYPENNNNALKIAKDLILLTKDFKGPAVPTDSLLGSVVYTRYGGFNPIKQINENNVTGHYIYNSNRELVPDLLTIPFKLSKDIEWPFSEIAQPVLPVRNKLMNNRYKTLYILKSDVKGRVIQGIYFKSIFNIRLCLIKEGVKNMWADDYGRDIVDRLQWQHELNKELHQHIPLPKIFDLFCEQENTYLIMEFIKGETFDYETKFIYDKNSWFQLSNTQKLRLVNYLLIILQAIQELHAKGYVHRDITPNNFLIGKNGKIYLIDLELSYSISQKKPHPPFKQGTPGFMSPEQMDLQTPTIKEDIYAIGAMMIYVFTGMYPAKIDCNCKLFMSHLQQFTDNFAIINLINKCIDRDPEKRPGLADVKNTLKKYEEVLQQPTLLEKSATHPELIIDINEIRNVVYKALNKLTSKSLDSKSYRQPTEQIPNLTLSKGLCGIIYILAMAKKNGYDIDTYLPGILDDCQYAFTNNLDQDLSTIPGLFDGQAGVALAIHEGMQTGILKGNIYQTHLSSCFGSIVSSFNIANGITGQGIALLRCQTYLDQTFFQTTLNAIVDRLLSTQQKDGCWHNYRADKRVKDNTIGLGYGTAGILCFLASYAQHFSDSQVIPSIQLGLHWLYKNAIKNNNNYTWHTSTQSKSIDGFGCIMGVPGVALAFMKGYELLKEPLYQKIVEKVLHSLPLQTTYSDYTQIHGLSGLGEVYMEANRVFNTMEWQKRIDWITNLFMHTFLEEETNQSGYWSMDVSSEFDPGLFTGVSGILHFLMRYRSPDKASRHLLLFE